MRAALILVLIASAVAAQIKTPGYQSNFDSAKKFYAQGRFQEAEWFMAAALAEVDNSSTPDPLLAATLFELAEIDRAQGKYPEAQALLERLLALESPESVKTLQALARIDRAQAKYDLAEPLYRRALAAEEATYGKFASELLTTLQEYSELLRKMKQPAQAARLESRARQLARSAPKQ